MAGSQEEIRARGSYFPGDWVRPRYNPSDWIPLVDAAEIFTGHRSVDRQGRFELYDAPVGVVLRVEEARRSKPIITPEKEWELGGSINAFCIWHEGGKLKMLYQTVTSTCYAASDDGYHWERPSLNRVDWKGSTDNNITMDTPIGASGFFEDPSAPASERYKAMGGHGFWIDLDTGEEVPNDEADKLWRAWQYAGRNYQGRKVELKGHLHGWTSADRLEWKPMPEPLARYSVNGGIAARYDAETGSYFAYMQPQGAAPTELVGIGSGAPETEVVRRAVGIARTNDFSNWPASKLLIHPDAQDPLDISFYGACYFAYPGRTDLHAMILPVFHQIDDHVDMQIAFSRDGLIWSRPERRPILQVGERGDGDECQIHPWRNGMVELPDGNWAVSYQTRSDLHNVEAEFHSEIFPEMQEPQLCWALWRPHRFCGVEAEKEGRFTIPTIFRQEDELRLNYRCAPGGWISVELLEFLPSMFCVDVDPIPGFSFAECDRLQGDEEDQVVSWNSKNDISGVGETVGIRIRMFQAKLFAYRV